MAAKKVVSLKIDPDKLEELREIARRENKTLTDVLTGGTYDQTSALHAKRELETLRRKHAELEARYEAATGHRPPTTKRITIPVTDQEHEAIRRAAADQNKSMGRMVRDALTKRQELPALEGGGNT